MMRSIIQAFFQPNLREQQEKQQRIYDLLYAEKQAKVCFSTVYKAKENVFKEKNLLKEKGKNKNKRKLFNGSRYGD